MIDVENVNFRYSKGRALFKNLSLDLEPGHIYGLLGKNGAGKSTLLKVMAGLLFPQSGTATTLNLPACLRKKEMLQNLFFLPEELYVPHLTINRLQSIYAPFYPYFSQEQFYEYLNKFEISHYDDYVDKLSHGQKKKVMICFALATNTSVLFMDEPTNGLDIPSKTEFRRIMASAATEDKLVLISTHQVRDLSNLIDAVVVLNNGEILLNQSTYNIAEKISFDVVQTADEDVIYAEETVQGLVAVRENKTGIGSRIDLELLFNAIICNKDKFKELFM